MSKEQDPLVKDEQLREQTRVGFSYMFGTTYEKIKALTATQVREIYESARSKDADLIKATFKKLNEIHTLLENASANYADGTTKGEGEADKLGRVIHVAETRLSEVLQRINDRSK